MAWREYHESTKHSSESLYRDPHYLDWDNMPHPFRHYEGVPLIDLPADPEPPGTPVLDLLRGAAPPLRNEDSATFLSALFFYSAAISATKRIPSTGGRYALRVNPSSGNLHPTEFHFTARGLPHWPDGAYHYRPSSHMAEQRAAGTLPLPEPLTLVLTSIAWREAWKYRSRAYRYCLHDIGHAWQCVELAARALGCRTTAQGLFDDDELAQTLRLAGDEWPMLLLHIDAASTLRDPDPVVWFAGTPNRLSAETIAYPEIERIHNAAKRPFAKPEAAPLLAVGGAISLPPPAASHRPFGAIARTRRSALDFIGGDKSMDLSALSALLDAAQRPLAADFARVPFVQLYLYAHRIDGLDPGVYRHWPNTRELEPVRPGDQRVAAAGLSLGQDLAGNACVAFSMIADLERATGAHGDRGYRYAHFEAGAIGQRLYLAAEALGLRATGIGAFFDDRVHEYLDLSRDAGQVIYHFAIGYPVTDPRLDA